MSVLDKINETLPSFGGLLNVAGSIWQTSQQRKEAALQRDWNEAMMDKQNEFSLDMWNRTNEYNTPSNQLDRLKDAGLNPLFYSLDGTGNASAFQSAGVQGYNSPDIQNPFASYDPLTMAQVENIRADTRNKDANSDYTKSLQATEDLLRQGKFNLQGVEFNLKTENVRLTQREIDQIAQNIVESEERCKKIQADINIAWQKLDNETKLQRLEHIKVQFNQWLESQKLSQKDREIAIQVYDSETRRLVADSDIEFNDANKLLIEAKQATEEQNAILLSEKTVTEQSYRDNIEADTSLKGTEQYYQEERNRIYDIYGEKQAKLGVRAQRAANVASVVNTSCQVVDTAMSAYSSFVTGGMSDAFKGSIGN